MTNFLVNWTANLKLAIEIELLIKANRYRLYNVQCFFLPGDYSRDC